jgi:DNA-binding beta-propeller fold protein YncE
VPYTVEPALPFSLTAAPQDTVVAVGASFTSRSTVVDRFGNSLNEAVALTEPSANLSVAGSQITATGPGRGTVTARAGALTDLLRVFVGPLSTISGLTPTELVQFATNGNVSSHVPLGRAGGPFTADWSVNGQLLVADDLGGGPLRIIFPNGEALTIPVPSDDDWPLYPEFSPDGQWIYYARSDLGWHIRRVRVDGGGDQAVANVPVNHAAPSLSPDGTLMAMVNLIPDRIEIFEFATNSIREIAAAAHSPAWSPDGDLIAFVNTTSGQIEVISPSGSGRRVISPEGMRFRVGIDWTQDGLFVVAYEVDSETILAIDPQSGATIEYRYPGIGAPAARPR